ncbi:GGDEF domain-containing protein [Maritimibacter sp. DP1N21-5]|nr:GGDEF domain-containing protein [Maritimibacter sp. DP1N21-5]MBV7409224.1 GGDEF domain-containing protein [Maritimibacter sp. DP1N21-5]
MPMHFRMSRDGFLRHAAPTLIKVAGEAALAGRPVADAFDLRRESGPGLIDRLTNSSSTKIHLRLRDRHRTQLIAVPVQLPTGDVLVNLSFGIAVLDAVSRYHLAGSDFAPTDLTLELLYLVEANMAAMNESRALNERLQGARMAAEAQALTDTLTGLRNRRALDVVLSRLAERSMPFALAHLDLDFFKAVNDTHGHAAGDRVLVDVARILLEETREDDTVARVGGDEFVLVFAGLVDQRRLQAILMRIIRRLEEPILFRGTTCRISSSAGVVQSTHYDPVDIARMHADADQALYASKAAGRGRVTFHGLPPERAGRLAGDVGPGGRDAEERPARSEG